MGKILPITELDPKALAMKVAERVKARRLEMNLTQEGLAARAGVKLPTYRRFERTGNISFKSLLQIGIALEMHKDINSLFAKSKLCEIVKERKRGKVNE